MAADINNCDCPTITHPNGGEVITARTIQVQWYRPGLHSVEPNDSNWFDLFFTDSYEPDKQNNWLQIASVPSNAKAFLWSVPFSIKSTMCRLAVRCRNFQGATTEMSISAGNFTISKRQLSSPAVVKPVSGEIYRQSLPIVFDHAAVKGTVSQRAFYQILYSSESKNLDWTMLVDNVPVGQSRIVIDTSDWDLADDYAFRITLIDADDAISEPAFVRGVKISPLPYFILDSKPPTGNISIQGNMQYTRERNIVLLLDAVDEATAVDTVNISENGGSSISAPFNDIVTWRLAESEGEKVVQADFIDIAGNSSANSINIPITPYYSDNNQVIDALIVDSSGTPFFVVGGSSLNFVEGKNDRGNTPAEVTALCKFGEVFFFGVLSEDNKGSLYREYPKGTIESVHDFSDTDSRITALAVLGDVLYIGLQNGSLYSFDGTTVSFVSDRNNTITKMISDNANLYIFVDNDNEVEIYNGSSFIVASVVNALR